MSKETFDNLLNMVCDFLNFLSKCLVYFTQFLDNMFHLYLYEDIMEAPLG